MTLLKLQKMKGDEYLWAEETGFDFKIARAI